MPPIAEDLQISCREAEQVAQKLYGLDVTANALPGELDQNFRIEEKNGKRFVLKISRPGTDLDLLHFQKDLLSHLHKKGELHAPGAFPDLKGSLISKYQDRLGKDRRVRLLSWMSGRIYSSVNPQTDELRFSLGKTCGALTKSLSDFEHPAAERKLEWDVAQGYWTADHLNLFSEAETEVIRFFQRRFREEQTDYDQLRRSVVHNDANDNNIIVTEDLKDPEVKGLIDFGDAIFTQVINDIAISCCYAIQGLPDPLSGALPVVAGYHEEFPINEKELRHLYTCIGMRLVISVSKSALNKIHEPENAYLQISDKAGWDLLYKWRDIDSEFALASFRKACSMTSHQGYDDFVRWATRNSIRVNDLFPDTQCEDVLPIDLSVGSTWLGHPTEFADFGFFQFKLDRLQKSAPDRIPAGGYLEPRMVYTTEEYDKKGNSGRESRTVHLGVDFWLPAGSKVHTPFEGEVVVAVNDSGDKEYGGLIILKHFFEENQKTKDQPAQNLNCFYTLYGHLDPSHATKWKMGDQISKGQFLAELGDYPQNGNWPPHLHFQVMLSLLGMEKDFPGVAFSKETAVYEEICPDPNLLFQLESLKRKDSFGDHFDRKLIDLRLNHLGEGLSLSYEEPLHIVRGNGVYLYDSSGKKYLDTVNNVAHVGHEHPAVVKTGQQQMAVLNTNTRYLHENVLELVEELKATLPGSLEVFHFVNSGSEANELALRMIKTATGQSDVLVSEFGYHGNTNACVEISSYKFDGKGGNGCPEHTHVFPLPDSFRGKYRGSEAGPAYAREVRERISDVQSNGRNIAGMILEPIISCGGQVELPQGFLGPVYEAVRKAGGYTISDEVQVGCGRMGSSFWGFELYGVVPDIVTIGKPLGNGHPVAAVACTKEVAAGFSTGMEFFNTFGGNPVSTAIAAEVLRTVRKEKLQENASKTGSWLKAKLKELQVAHPVLADIRGQGLFLGIELTDENLDPEPEKTRYLINRMKEFGFLMSLDGPDHNVLKIKPPLVFSLENARELTDALELVLKEDFMSKGKDSRNK